MVEPIARIRAFKASDERQVKFAIGKSNLESLAVANRRGASFPFIIAICSNFHILQPTSTRLLSAAGLQHHAC